MVSQTKMIMSLRNELLAIVSAFMECAGNPQPIEEEEDFDSLEDAFDSSIERVFKDMRH